MLKKNTIRTYDGFRPELYLGPMVIFYFALGATIQRQEATMSKETGLSFRFRFLSFHRCLELSRWIVKNVKPFLSMFMRSNIYTVCSCWKQSIY